MTYLDIPGGRISYDVRGAGPLLILTGAPMAGAMFVPLADELAGDHTVVTHDPRGIGASTLDDPHRDSTPDLRADDLAALIDALGAPDADVFGSSGGAVTALALATRQPRLVRTVVAHEPPLLDLLPDAAARHAATDDIIATYHREGIGAAFAAFLLTAGYTEEDLAAMPMGEPSEQDLADSARFMAHELRHTTRYVPDVAALRAGPVRVVVGVGAASGKLLTSRTSAALAERLGSPTVEFPGEHGGFLEAPAEFADVLRKALAAT